MISINKEKATDKKSIYVFKNLPLNYKHKGLFLTCDCFAIPRNLFIPFLLIEFQLGSYTTSIRTNFPSFPRRLAMNLCCSGGHGQISRAFLTIQLMCILCLCFIPSFTLCRTQSVPWTMRPRATLERHGAVTGKTPESLRTPCRRDIILAPGSLHPNCCVKEK